jgi:RecB family endonuclease NucS
LLTKPASGEESAALERVLGEADEEDIDNSELAEAAFALEYQLRDFIAANLDAIDVGGKHLRLYSDQAGRNGVEYPSAVGPIDILAVDETGAFYVFELKRARSPDHAIGQLTRYMGWVHQTIDRGRWVYRGQRDK